MIDIVWKRPSKIWTKMGPMFVRSWTIPSEYTTGFFKFWNQNQDLRNKGFSLKEEDGEWILSEWKKSVNGFSDIGKYEKKKKIIVPDKITLNVLPIENASGLRNWQPQVVEKLCAAIRKYGSAIDGSDLGTGKSYCSVAVARELKFKIAIICPKAVVTSWERIIRDHFHMEPIFVKNYESLRTGKHKKIGVWEKLNKKTTQKKFVWKLPNPENTLIVFDESHKIKSWETQNSEMAISAKKQGYKILCLSATSAINPLELRTIGMILDLHDGTSRKFNKFLEEHDCERGMFGWEFGGNQDALRKLNFDMFKERGARITKGEIPDFPDCDLTAEAFDLDDSSTDDMNQILFEMNREIQIINKTIKSEKEKQSMEMTAQLRARQKCELLKVPLFVEMTEEALRLNMSVAIFVNFSETIKALMVRLNTNCAVWGEDTKNRQQYVDDFQSDISPVIIVNIKAGGAGLSLHDLNGNRPRLAIISPTPSAVDLKQATGRVWRAGAKTKAIQKIIFAAGTEEEKVCNNLKIKLKNMDLINDGDLSPNQIFKE